RVLAGPDGCRRRKRLWRVLKSYVLSGLPARGLLYKLPSDQSPTERILRRHSDQLGRLALAYQRGQLLDLGMLFELPSGRQSRRPGRDIAVLSGEADGAKTDFVAATEILWCDVVHDPCSRAWSAGDVSTCGCRRARAGASLESGDARSAERQGPRR